MSDETLDLAIDAKVAVVDRIVPGTETAPGMTFVGDADTGIWSSSDGIINFSTNAVKRITIDTAAMTSALPFYQLLYSIQFRTHFSS